MKRRHGHALFAALALACALVAGVQAVRLQRALATNEAVLHATAGAARVQPPPDEAGLALALAYAKADDYDRALAAYKKVIEGGREDLKRAALYNLGNLHLRAARRADASDKARALALVELAKQSYRDLLRLDPADWDARYNLERALWMAPERDDTDEELPPPLDSERAITTMRSRGGLP